MRPFRVAVTFLLRYLFRPPWTRRTRLHQHVESPPPAGRAVVNGYDAPLLFSGFTMHNSGRLFSRILPHECCIPGLLVDMHTCVTYVPLAMLASNCRQVSASASTCKCDRQARLAPAFSFQNPECDPIVRARLSACFTFVSPTGGSSSPRASGSARGEASVVAPEARGDR